MNNENKAQEAAENYVLNIFGDSHLYQRPREQATNHFLAGVSWKETQGQASETEQLVPTETLVEMVRARLNTLEIHKWVDGGSYEEIRDKDYVAESIVDDILHLQNHAIQCKGQASPIGLKGETQLLNEKELQDLTDRIENGFIERLFERLTFRGGYDVGYDIDGSDSDPAKLIGDWIIDKINEASPIAAAPDAPMEFTEEDEKELNHLRELQKMTSRWLSLDEESRINELVNKKTLAHAASQLSSPMEELNELLDEIQEYFDDNADADFQGDPGEFIPNKEAKLASELKRVREKVKQKEAIIDIMNADAKDGLYSDEKPHYEIFNEDALGKEIERIWGAHGGHMDVYRSLLARFRMTGSEVSAGARKRFEELLHKEWDWKSFYNGWIEGRTNLIFKNGKSKA